MNLDRQYYLDLFRAAIARVGGGNGEPTVDDFRQTVADLEQAAPFLPGAKAKLAVLTAMGAGTPTDHEKANTLFLEAASTGIPPIARELGAIVLMSGVDDGLAGSLLKRAVSGGDWIAGFLILREALRGRVFLPQDELLTIAGSLSDAVPFKDEILASVQELPNDVILVQTTELDLDVCQKALDTLSQKHASNAPIATTDTPEVASHNNVLTPFECDYLITISCSLMQPSKVVSADKAGSVQQGYRTSDGAVLLPHMLDLPTVRIIEKLAEISGIDASHGEFLSLLRYKPGQEYRPHHDFLQVDENDYSMIGRCGQRCATLLTYLNEGFEGGETEFPALEFQYEGRTGSSLYFRNTDRAGKPIQDSLHAGLPIIKGEKWMATLWIRERPFWPWARTP